LIYTVKLAALATLAATGAFAQSSVTLSGVLDFSYATISGNGTTADTKLNTVSSTGQTSATSSINLHAVEDLGGGLKGEMRYEIDPRANANGGAAFGRHQVFVGASGGFGAVKLGAPNAASLQAFLASSPLGTGIGSAFSLSDNSAVTVNTVRYSNSVRYDTPSFSGFGASVTHAPGNDDATKGGAAPAITNLGLTYSNGPLNVVFSSLQTSATGAQVAVATTATAIGTAAVDARVKGTFNYLAANYALGNAKVFVGYGDGDKSTTTGLDTKVSRVGASYTMGAVTLIGQYATTEIGTAAKRKTTGLRADYALSKRTAAYFGYEAYDSGAATANKTNIAAVGLRHNF
jgi:predicted porin